MSPFLRQKAACGYFFAVPGLAYGILTARMPALKAMVAANDSAIGFLLLAFGAASFCGLSLCRFAIDRFGAKNVMGWTSVALSFFLLVASLAFNYWQLLICCLFGGFFSGLCEVAMNAQGMLIEGRYKKLCMSSLHACFSLGGMIGSLSGSLFAWLNLAPAWNFLLVCGGYLCLFKLAFRKLERIDGARSQEKRVAPKSAVPAIIYLYGITSMLCYVSEGSVGEWGSILLHSAKGAPQGQAALVFACFCLSMVVFRFLGDRMRETFGDLLIVVFGGLLGSASMSVVLLSPAPAVCLAAYAVMGVGFAPIVPILFSRAGKTPGVSQAKASSTMSIMSYTGLLVFPPFLGMLGDCIGLDRALWIIVAACALVSIAGFMLFRKK